MHKIVQTIITSFTKEELREFKYFLKGRENITSERNDLKMVDDVRNGRESEGSGNASYQTRKRLKKQLELFVQIQNVKQNNVSAIINYIEAGRYCFRKELYREAWQYLRMAEKEAQQAEEYELLDYIYYTQVSALLGSWFILPSPLFVPELIQQREKNTELIRSNAHVKASYLLLLHELRKLKALNVFGDIDAVIQKIFKQHNLDHRIYDNPNMYITIVSLICRVLREKKEYTQLKEYSVKSYREMKKRKMLDKILPEHLMDLLRSIYQASTRTKDYKTATEMQQLYNMEKERFVIQPDKYIYFNLRSKIMAADLYMFSNKLDKAKVILSELNAEYAAQNKNAIVYFLLRMNELALYFKLNDYEKCSQIYAGVIQQYSRQVLQEEGLGLEMLIYTEIYGVVLAYEKEEFEYALYLINRLKLKYAKVFKTLNREYIFLKTVEKMVKKPDYQTSEKFKEAVNKFATLKEYIPGDKEYISMSAWLEAKLTGTSYYDCFLKLC